LGNPESFNSCSHGAGRRMGRAEAIRSLSLEEEQSKMEKLHIIGGPRTQQELDEAPGAYKSIDMVMEQQSDLVEIVTKLTPLCVIKG
jgi:tRNA-splicing ligase RtcB